MNIVAGIIACEIGFWVVLALGLVARYPLRMPGVSRVLLLCVPLLDVALLSLITWDLLANGASADFTHGLGAVYLGFTVAFGHQIIQRVDAWFAYRFAGGPVPDTPPKAGPGRVRFEWTQWLRMLLCAGITTVVLGGIVILVGDSARTAELLGWVARIWIVAAVWLIGWPVWVTMSHIGRASPARAPRA
ncbi:hypothetical protein [Microbacterium karelineae]|uniref:hypothetical protein n=1 Tax=Microbacterium karelineae TaxID=2654283 RepID=UPI0012EA6B5A|nr:hypothetical protein [Microbacterium karelineae]